MVEVCKFLKDEQGNMYSTSALEYSRSTVFPKDVYHVFTTWKRRNNSNASCLVFNRPFFS